MQKETRSLNFGTLILMITRLCKVARGGIRGRQTGISEFINGSVTITATAMLGQIVVKLVLQVIGAAALTQYKEKRS
jgi:hypothetical protein